MCVCVCVCWGGVYTIKNRKYNKRKMYMQNVI